MNHLVIQDSEIKLHPVLGATALITMRLLAPAKTKHLLIFKIQCVSNGDLTLTL